VILAWGPLAPEASAFEPRVGPIYHKNRAFRIPFNIDAEDRPRIRQVQLWVSEDRGYTWEMNSERSPNQATFTFRAPRDGEYWFAVRTLGTNGKLYPANDKEVEPNMRVVVDTTPPSLVLAPMGRRGSRASVRWEIRDENLDMKSLVIEYQPRGAPEWRQVPNLRYALIGAADWDAGTADPLRVRASVDDKAGNRATADLDLDDGLAANPSPGTVEPRDFATPPPVAPISSASMKDGQAPDLDPFAPADGRSNAPPPASEETLHGNSGTARGGGQTLLVGTPRFPLQYAVDDAGQTGPSLVELWVTRDGGRTWSRHQEDTDRVSPYQVDLGGEGTFGLWLVVQGANGLGDPPPAPGDRPQMWVEVDSSPPVVQLDQPKLGVGTQAGRVVLTWRATDAHLDAKPIVISYRPDRPDAVWQQITGRMENTGRFVWNVPASVPPRFHIRVDAFDTLGNRGSAETTDTGPIIIDRARPRGRIIGLDPSARVGTVNRSIR
jgi:hypothetical protein